MDVLRIHNGFQQPVTEYQEHNGAVNTMTSAKVQYVYADRSDQTIRLTGLTYPNGNTLTFNFGTSGAANDQLSRVESLTSSLSDSVVAEYSYLRLATSVQVTYPDPQVQFNLAVASGANHYTGLDAFSRIVTNLWQNVSSMTPTDMVRLNYGYDRASNRLWREDAVAKAQSTPKYLDEFYGNDGLYRLSSMVRGELTGTPPSGVTSENFGQGWTLDPTGNWGTFIEKADGSTVSLDQTRTSTTVNQIYGVTNSTGGPWVTPDYDSAGNMTTMPQPNSLGDAYNGIFDAWKRLKTLVDATTSDTVQVNSYDGRNFRIVRVTYSGDSPSETRQFYHSTSWQVLEEQVTAGTPDRQYVWGLRYIDDLILRDQFVSGTFSQRLYALQDANWNVVAISDIYGTVQEL